MFLATIEVRLSAVFLSDSFPSSRFLATGLPTTAFDLEALVYFTAVGSGDDSDSEDSSDDEELLELDSWMGWEDR